MKFFATVCAMLCVSISTLAFAHGMALPEKRYPYYPKPELTPGAVDPAATKESVCNQEYQRTNFTTDDLSAEAYQRYNVDAMEYPCPCKLERLVPTSLGGADAIENIWPHPYHTQYGARIKEHVEKQLHKEVCEDEIPLERAQEIIRTDWISCYRTLNDGELCR